MFSDKVLAIISSAKDRAYLLGFEFLDIESMLAAVGRNKEAGIRLSECLASANPAELRKNCPEYGREGRCPVSMEPDMELQLVLQCACKLAGGEGIPDRTSPGRVLLEHLICALAMSTVTAEILGDEIAAISEKDALHYLARWLLEEASNVTLGKLAQQLRDLRKELLNKVFGQDHAIHVLIEGLYAALLNAGADTERKRPLGVFVFAGPPGVGKTYMSELCSAFLKRPFRRFDMTGYSDHQANNELVGFAPSYKGAKPGLLSGFVKENPTALLLFDEIEKAHLTTMQLFYQILDAGRLQDKFEDEDVSFKDTIIVFTTNAGKSLYDYPNRSGIATTNATYHKRTILNALENEKNPANGQPAFPQAICSRLGQGYPVMFNHLGVNELERIANAEMLRTEALLERQYFKAFSHTPLLPMLLVLREGADIDARQLRSEAERFIKMELFKFSSMYESRRLEEIFDAIDEVYFAVGRNELTSHPEISALFNNNTHVPIILLAANNELLENYQKKIPEIQWIGVLSAEEAIERLAVTEVDFVLLDLWMRTEDLSKSSNGTVAACKNSESFKTISAKADYIPLASQRLDLGRKILKGIHERFPNQPVYLLSSLPFNEDQGFSENSESAFQGTVTVDAGRKRGASLGAFGPVHLIDEELLLACVRSGGARGLISTDYGFDRFDNYSREGFLGAIQEINESLSREKLAHRLTKQHQSIAFESDMQIVGKMKQLLISFKDFRLKRVIDAADVGQMVSDIERPLIGFGDVFGAEEAKQSMEFVVNWLKNPKRYAGLGLKPPRGILMTGPPGTGKTMLAKAVAGESECAFCQTSATNFVTMWQGSGPQNVRELFNRARRYSPSIIFIDEIDAVGKERQGSSFSRAQEDTLNALLTEMDGFGSTDEFPVIVLAATNLADKLDTALKRRFDREVVVGLPDRDARLAFLRFTFSQRQRSDVSDEVLMDIAAQSPGMTIADLGRIVQEAGVMASQAQITISDSHLLESFDKIRFGAKSSAKGEIALLRTARHEGGHAFVGWKLGKGIFSVTVIGRRGSGGHVEWKPDESFLKTRPQIEDEICACMAGRAAELEFYGEKDGLSTGVGKATKGNPGSGDLPRATQLALDMIRGFGMCEEIGQISIDVLAEQYAIPPLAEKTLALAETVVRSQMKRAREMIKSDLKTFNALVERLVEDNRLDENSITEILGPLES